MKQDEECVDVYEDCCLTIMVPTGEWGNYENEPTFVTQYSEYKTQKINEYREQLRTERDSNRVTTEEDFDMLFEDLAEIKELLKTRGIFMMCSTNSIYLTYYTEEPIFVPAERTCVTVEGCPYEQRICGVLNSYNTEILLNQGVLDFDMKDYIAKVKENNNFHITHTHAK